MSENVSDSSYAVRKITKQKVTTRKGPLSVINGNINTRKRNCNKVKNNYKIQKHEKFVAHPYLPDTQKFHIFEDKENEVVDNITDNGTAVHDSSNTTNEIPSSSSPDCIEVTPEILKESHFFYSKKKKNASTDLIWHTPYRQDIYAYLKETERNFHPNPKYMDKQPDLNMKMRSILVDWCVEVVEEYKMQSETLYLSVSFFDRFLSRVSVLRGKLQLVGTASMFLASKFEEIYPPELKDFVFITDNTYSKQQVLRMEHLILKVLNFDLCAPTPYTFLQLYLSMCSAPDNIVHLSQYICEISLLDGNAYLKYLPSIIAASALALANYTLGLEFWDKNIESLTGYKLMDLCHCITFLYIKMEEMPRFTEKSIYLKYKSPVNGCASLVSCPRELKFPFPHCSCAYC